VTVSAFEAGAEQILVPQRVDPEHDLEVVSARPVGKPTGPKREVDGTEPFEQAIARAPAADQAGLRRLLDWARELEAERLASLRTVLGDGRHPLLVWVPGQKAGLVSIWNESGPYLSLWRSVFVRFAWNHLPVIERIVGQPLGQGTGVRDPSDELLEAIADAYREALAGQPTWNGRDFYVAFGEDARRSWDDARKYGFIAAGGGEWYSRSLKQLKPGHRVFAYIPKGSGVGGYVGVGEVTAEALMARDFKVESNGSTSPYLAVAQAPEAGKDADDAALAEWVVPVRWLETRDREHAVKDSDFFANQNSAVKLTHGYTLEQLCVAFGVNT